MLNSARAYGLLGALLFFVALATAPRPRFFAAAGFFVLFLDLAIVMALYAVCSAPRAALVARGPHQIPLSRQHKELWAAPVRQTALQSSEEPLSSVSLH